MHEADTDTNPRHAFHNAEVDALAADDLDRPRGRLYVEPRLPRWPAAMLFLWAGLPALLVGPSVWLSDMQAPPAVEMIIDACRYIGLYGAPVILYLWSAQLLRTRGETKWWIKSIPLTVTMIAINATIVFGGRRMSPGGVGAAIESESNGARIAFVHCETSSAKLNI